MMISNFRDHHDDRFKAVPVAVTGGAGFIGSHLVEALTCLGAQVTAIDDLTTGKWSNHTGFDQNVKQVTASIADESAMVAALTGCRYLFHHAALVSVPHSVQNPMDYYRVNAMGTATLFRAAVTAGVSRIIYAGSSSAYGDPQPNPGAISETLAPHPLSPYAATKLTGELTAQAFSACYPIEAVVLRYFNIFGPRQDPASAYAAVIAAFAMALLNDRHPKIFGDGNQTRDFTYIENVVHANLLAASVPGPCKGDVFNIGCGRPITVNDLYHEMVKVLNKPQLTCEYHPARAGDVRDSLADISRAKNRLGYTPLVDFETGLAQTVNWYRQNLSR